MRATAIKATIQRRFLVNYRIDPSALAAVVPAPFRPQVVAGYGIGAICPIRLGQVRPAGGPAAVGMVQT